LLLGNAGLACILGKILLLLKIERVKGKQGDQMHRCKNRQHFTKKAQITKHSPPKKRYRPSKKAPVSSIQAKKSATDLQK